MLRNLLGNASIGRAVFYYTTYDNLGRRRQFSTGKTMKSDAKRYCQELFRSGTLVQERPKKFAEYTRDWYVWEKCPYITGKLLRGFNYSHSIADTKRATLERRILPYFGSFYRKDISTTHIEDWIQRMARTKVTNITVNHYLATLRTIFNEAHRIGDISVNPMAAVQPLSEKIKKKDVLTNDEVRQLFSLENRARIWPKELYYLINLVASQTGMRMGEIQALHKENLHPDHILVMHSWNRKYGLKGTKSGKDRIVPIRPELYTTLKNYLNRTDLSGPYVFSAFDGEQPVEPPRVYRRQNPVRGWSHGKEKQQVS